MSRCRPLSGQDAVNIGWSRNASSVSRKEVDQERSYTVDESKLGLSENQSKVETEGSGLDAPACMFRAVAGVGQSGICLGTSTIEDLAQRTNLRPNPDPERPFQRQAPSEPNPNRPQATSTGSASTWPACCEVDAAPCVHVLCVLRRRQSSPRGSCGDVAGAPLAFTPAFSVRVPGGATSRVACIASSRRLSWSGRGSCGQRSTPYHLTLGRARGGHKGHAS